ncbi:hypothetical protein HNR44_000531 [Geomicrobium halophilum]|uniref:Uncharacterized protein n=1 Tax=Geomicrobium halophilum TaxID=549000 RepID=A0A841PX01_9BACL|nr:hypothetical protein [Geomicrobium halophilum]MBB6448582.1 hypothetical protein [Geomicrobium halophilum]
MKIEDVNMRISVLQDAYQRNMVDEYQYRKKMNDLEKKRTELTQQKLETDQLMERTKKWMKWQLIH